VMLRKGRIIRS